MSGLMEIGTGVGPTVYYELRLSMRLRGLYTIYSSQQSQPGRTAMPTHSKTTLPWLRKRTFDRYIRPNVPLLTTATAKR